jgi:hypothetical protein
MPPETPFAEDSAVCEVAERFGLVMARYETIEIDDEAAIARAGLMTTRPDYARIRKALVAGVAIEGARRGAIQYSLKRREVSNAD